MKNRFWDSLNVRPGEKKIVGLLFSHAALNGLHLGFLYNCAYTLFMAKLGAEQLPFIYMVVALTGTVITSGLMVLQKKAGAVLTYYIILLIGIGGAILLRATLLTSESKAMIFAIPVWAETWLCLLNVEFYGLFNNVLDVRQSKRLSGLIRSGMFLAGAVGGFATGAIVKVVGVENLLFLTAILLTATFILMQRIISSSPEKFAGKSAAPKADAKSQNSGTGINALLKNRLILLLFGMAALYTITYYFIDTAFYATAKQQFPIKTELSGFLGIFGGAAQTATLLGSLFISTWAMNRLGVGLGLLAMPFLTGLFALVAFFGGAVSHSTGLLFSLIVGLRFARIIIAPTVMQPSMGMIYQVLPPSLRSQAIPLVSGVIDPVASGVSGLLLLLLMKGIHLGIPELAGIMALLFLVWFVLAFLAKKDYLSALAKSLDRRSLGQGSEMDLKDPALIANIASRLGSPFLPEVIYCLDLLEKAPQAGLYKNHLLALINHEKPEIRIEIMQRLSKDPVHEAKEFLIERINFETDEIALMETLIALAACAEEDSLDYLQVYLTSASELLRLGAMVGLLRSGGLEGVMAAGSDLQNALKSLDPTDRCFAARVLGRVNISQFYRPLRNLLADSNHTVKISALEAAMQLKNIKLAPDLIPLLDLPGLREPASKALISLGDELIPILRQEFTSENVKTEHQIRLLRLCGRVSGPQAETLLFSALSHPNRYVRDEGLANLFKAGFNAKSPHFAVLEEELTRQVHQAAWSLGCINDLKEGQSVELLNTALHEELAIARDKCLMILTFLDESGLIREARGTLNNPRSTNKANALELLETTLSKDHKAKVMPLFEETDTVRCLVKLPSQFKQESSDMETRITTILNGSILWLLDWTRACSIYASIYQTGAVKYKESIQKCAAADSPLLQESAQWALKKIT